MRLVSLNAWGGNLFEPLLAYLDRVRPDILCLQEVTEAVDAGPDRVHFREHGFDLGQCPDLFAAVAALLPHHRAFFAPSAQGEVVDGAGKGYRSRFGIASFIDRRFAVIGQAQDFVHGTYIPDGWGTPPVPRTLQALRLCDADTGRPFVAAHLHGLRDPAGKHDTPARAAQAQRAIALLDRVRRPGDAVVLAGDLNLLPDSASFAAFRQAGLVDLVTSRGFTDTRTTLYRKPQRYADYCLISPEVDVTGFDVPAEPVVSDHRPLVLDFVV